jgi:hypothetical protein
MGRKYFKWTPEAVARLRQLAGTTTIAWIAEDLGCTRWAVVSKIFQLGLKGWETGKHGARPAPAIPMPPTKAADRAKEARVQRMMHLSWRIETLKSWQGKAA